MKRPRFLHGVLFALAASILGSVLHSSLSALFGPGWSVRLLIPLLALAYLLFLLGRSGRRRGRVVTVSAWSVLAAGLWLLQPSLAIYLLTHLGALWLLRSLYHHSGLLPVLADLALNGLALACGFWAAGHSGSLLLSLWSFFLIQALFVFIPDRFGTRAGPAMEAEDPFARAHRAAECAVRKLTTTH